MKPVAAVFFLIALAACSRPSTPALIPDAPASAGAASARAARTSAGFSTLVQFKGSNGCTPIGGLVAAGTTLYGTTTCGGAHHKGNIFRVDISGKKFHVVRDFGRAEQGTSSTLLLVGSTLYGTASQGGPKGYGSVYSIGLNGKVNWVKGFTEAAHPYGGLTELNGEFYGTTVNGGGFGSCGVLGCGTVFKTGPSGEPTTIYSFGHTAIGPANPYGRLSVYDGALYGTTKLGGLYNTGTVFRVTTSGQEGMVFGFGDYNGGVSPSGALAIVKGPRFYGTTETGGKFRQGSVYRDPGYGRPWGYSFGASSNDGAQPEGGVIRMGGAVYGTTSAGGDAGCGTIFEITGKRAASIVERVLHRFAGSADGCHPMSELTPVNGVLYGTTSSGGANNGGTVFALKP